MRKPLLWGIAAGGVGTIALDVVSYVDMVVRARPASSLPAEVAGALAGGTADNSTRSHPRVARPASSRMRDPPGNRVA